MIDKFSYLGNTLSRAVQTDDEVNNMIAESLQHLADYMEMTGIVVKLGSIQSYSTNSTLICMRDLGILPTPHKLRWETLNPCLVEPGYTLPLQTV